MANIMSQKDVRNHVHRNGFDLSFRNSYTAKVGQLLPVLCKEVIPGDKFNIDINSFTRTRPVQTAAFARLQEYYDFYFVPTSLLWDKFPNFIVQTNNYNHASGMMSSPDNLQNHPYITLGNLRAYYRNVKNSPVYKNDIMGFSRADNTKRLLEYLGYGGIDTYLDYSDSDAALMPNFSLNPFPLAAYQKVCQDYFRDTQWQTSQPQRYNFDWIFNQSQMSLGVAGLGTVAAGRWNLFDLNYAPYKKDLFLGLQPRAQFGDTAVASPLVGTQRMTFSSVNPVSGDVNNGFIATLNNQQESVGYALGEGIGVSVFALRFAEASQKWKEITQSGTLDYKEQIQKHWNVKVSDDQSYRCKWLGGSSGNIAINEVTNNNLADGASAVLAGKGVASINKRNVVNFTSNEYGYIIGIYHAMPVVDWSARGLDRMTLKVSASDYAIPEFDNIGMENVRLLELAASPDFDTDVDFERLQFLTSSLGYAPRYYDYKQSVDVVRGAFIHVDSDGTWVAPLNSTKRVNSYFVHNANNAVNLSYPFFLCSPSDVDTLFGVNAKATSAWDTDQLLIAAYFDIKVVRNLSVSGLPY